MCGWQVKQCDPIVTHGPFLSALEMLHDKALLRLLNACIVAVPASCSVERVIVFSKSGLIDAHIMLKCQTTFGVVFAKFSLCI